MSEPVRQVTYVVRTKGDRMRFLRDALESVRAQSRRSQVVVVLDRQASAERNDAFDQLVMLVGLVFGREDWELVSSTAENEAASHNRGLEAVESEYVTVLDDDDVVYPHHAEALASALDEDASVGVAYARVALYQCDRTTNAPQVKRMEWGRPFEPAELRSGNKITVHGALQRTEVARRDLWRPDDSPCADWGHWLRLASAGVRFKHVDSLVAEYRVRDAGESNVPRAEMVRATRAVQERWAR